MFKQFKAILGTHEKQVRLAAWSKCLPLHLEIAGLIPGLTTCESHGGNVAPVRFVWSMVQNKQHMNVSLVGTSQLDYPEYQYQSHAGYITDSVRSSAAQCQGLCSKDMENLTSWFIGSAKRHPILFFRCTGFIYFHYAAEEAGKPVCIQLQLRCIHAAVLVLELPSTHASL